MLKRFRKHFKLRNEATSVDLSNNELSNEARVALDDANNCFRVLILGPANAGKTTLLERLTESPAGAAVVTQNGQRIKDVTGGYNPRGIPSIDDEITYPANPALVFHESVGFEAGGAKEVETIWQFIRKRSLASPPQQLHAIWLCIPVDNDRPVAALLSDFFSEPTASVPIVAIFTKLDGRRTKVEIEVLGPAPSPSDFLLRALEVDQKVAQFVDALERQFRNQLFPPAGFLRVANMDEDTEQSIALCTQLLQTTADALPYGMQHSLLNLIIWKRHHQHHTRLPPSHLSSVPHFSKKQQGNEK
ncbi:hypothetical protein BS47DRAFT_1322676 [Hydnum rufescens UP504]|uniref:G domain-containing protein n=1 Tax=Hydnum rufescens UP504 TaxID=1448309 RepID=A0A9P6AF26_9AGAM|nr:hypothetical protein BS47DRAFT_1322676 [Hydnum rufescens UP504]